MIAVLAAIIYNCPQNKIIIIGVTGTKGKTTTTFMLDSVLTKAGKKVALCNGEIIKVGKKITKNQTDNTTPGSFVLRKFLKEAVKNNCQYAVIEVTSWAIVHSRVSGIAFDAAVLTNLAHEHLDLHQTMDKYRQAKAELFKILAKVKYKKEGVAKVSVLNADDPSFQFFRQFCSDQMITYAIMKVAEVRARELKTYPEFSQFVAEYKDFKETISLGIPGEFNVYNALAAISVALAYGIEWSFIKQGLKQLSIPGRFNYVDVGQGFRVIVDFAHNPNSFAKLFSAVRDIFPQSRLVAVYGSAGGRDQEKRPMQGEIAAQYLDFSVLTTDDPRNEDPKVIAEQIAAGLEKQGKKESRDYVFIKDRKEAFKYAFKMAGPGDVVMLLSMGAYDHMYVGHGKVEWNDEKKAIEALQELGLAG